MVRDLLVPLAQKKFADHWRDEHYQVRNDQRTKNGVRRAVQNVRTGQHAYARLDVHGNLREAEGDHADVSVQSGLGDERCAHVEWCKRQNFPPSPLNAPIESKYSFNCAEIVADCEQSTGFPLNDRSIMELNEILHTHRREWAIR